MGIGITELLVILVIVALVFGTQRLRNIGGDLGSAIKGFRKAMTDDEPAKLDQSNTDQNSDGNSNPTAKS